MQKTLQIVLLSTLSIAVTGCDSMTKQDVGVITGGAVGALVGSQFGGGSGTAVAIAAGAIVGGLIGGQIGKTMDKQDQQQVAVALETSRTNQTIAWRNPDTGNQYQVTPTKTYQKRDNTYCREYQTTAIINGERQKMYGTACRQPDGSWKSVRSS